MPIIVKTITSGQICRSLGFLSQNLMFLDCACHIFLNFQFIYDSNYFLGSILASIFLYWIKLLISSYTILSGILQVLLHLSSLFLVGNARKWRQAYMRETL